jgi:hypothetical protein
MPIKQMNPSDQISQPAAAGMASDSYTHDVGDGPPRICADKSLPCETYVYDQEVVDGIAVPVRINRPKPKRAGGRSKAAAGRSR